MGVGRVLPRGPHPGVLLISQFWTLANLVYDPRQAKRLFGFVGGGAPLGGIAGNALAVAAPAFGAINLLLPSAALMFLCAFVVSLIIGRESVRPESSLSGKEEKGVSAAEAFQLLRSSKHLQIIALVIGFASIGAAIIEQQLNMAAAAAKGAGGADSITAFLAQVGLWMSVIGLRHPDVADEQDSPLHGHRVRADGAAGQPWHHGG